MRVTLIGHASLLFETRGGTLLMDPVFFDPFEGGAVTSCPEREVDLGKLPEIDCLVISHRHPDHFDIPSLARIPRTCRVLCPGDPLMLYALGQLGFTRVSPLEPGRVLSTADFQLLPTRSEELGVREFGLIVADGSGVVWNQVDTILSLATIQEVVARFGIIDLLIARYASQNFEFFESRTTAFPYEEHQRNLETVLAISPRGVVPGSAGFKFAGNHAWLNRYLFPVSAERFVTDLERLAPAIRPVLLRPGDVGEIEGGEVEVGRGASPFCRMTRYDTDLLRFDPTAPSPPLQDPNPTGYKEAEMSRTTAACLEGLYRYAVEHAGRRLTLAARYRRAGAVYQVEVVFPDKTRCWQIDFRVDPPRFQADGRVEANVVHRIAGSALTDWALRRRGYFYTRAYSRRFSTLYRLWGDDTGVEVRPLALPDLLIYYLLNVADDADEAAKRRIDLEIAETRRSGA
ncbi:MAG: MBL fold metallo-hydrolase [Candidatus Rokubacteria bacterium]|nr:MBL fold metallo-hydrolase [Candidatus Rokubacteria bacterium]